MTAFARSDLLAAAVTAGASVFCFGGCALATVGRFRRVPLRATSDSAGTVLRPEPWVGILLWVTFGAVVSSGVLYLIFAPLDSVDIELSTFRQIRNPQLIGAAVVLAVIGLVAYTRRGPGHVLLSPEGFEIRDILHTKGGSWTDVADITDNAPKPKTRQPIVLVMKDGQQRIIQSADGYAPNGAALYWMVRHYWRHPEDRDELTDGRALERLRTEAFNPE
ncbi:MAG: hypothetical protein K0U84_01245 [Actinomycetia bacterium]|nr:hypothetical protein [Actinomycetes bacterium]